MWQLAQQLARQVFAQLTHLNWMEFFHNIFIPFLGSLVLTGAKAIADDEKAISWEKSNDIALDLVILGVGLVCGIYIKTSTVEKAALSTFDAGMGDAAIAVLLLIIRHQKRKNGSSTGIVGGTTQLILGAFAVIWSTKAF